jgi:hypothetical protein
MERCSNDVIAIPAPKGEIIQFFLLAFTWNSKLLCQFSVVTFCPPRSKICLRDEGFNVWVRLEPEQPVLIIDPILPEQMWSSSSVSCNLSSTYL